MCMFCISLFVLLYFFFWPLCCLFFYDIRILIAPLVSSNSSCPSDVHGLYYMSMQHRINIDTFNIQKKIQTILDCSNLIRNKKHIQTWSQLEFQNRMLLHNLHASRCI
jgi:hypothetical protein